MDLYQVYRKGSPRPIYVKQTIDCDSLYKHLFALRSKVDFDLIVYCNHKYIGSIELDTLPFMQLGLYNFVFKSRRP